MRLSKSSKLYTNMKIFNRQSIRIFVSIGIIFSFLIIMPRIASATTPPTANTSAPTSIIDNTDSKYENGNYELNDFVYLAIRVSRIIMGLSGGVALGFFVYGGLLMLTSAGVGSKITTAKNIIMSSVIGLILIFSSYLITHFVLQTFGFDWRGKVEALPRINTEVK